MSKRRGLPLTWWLAGQLRLARPEETRDARQIEVSGTLRKARKRRGNGANPWCSLGKYGSQGTSGRFRDVPRHLRFDVRWCPFIALFCDLFEVGDATFAT